MNDIRRQRRIPLVTDARIIKLGSGESVDAKVVDVSNYGAGLRTKVPLNVNERIMVSVTLKQQSHFVHSEEVLSIVKHVENSKENSLAGINFIIRINDTVFPIFNQCLEYLKTHE